MVQRVVRSPKAMLVLVFGTILGAVWAAGSIASAAPKPNGVSLTPGPGISMTPNPITSAGTISANFGTVAGTVASGDHNHDGRYLLLTGGTVSGDLGVVGNAAFGGVVTFGPGAQLIAPRVQNAAAAPSNPGAGQLWWNTTSQALQYFDGTQWQAVPTGGAASPILGVSTSQSQASGTQAFQATTASVTFTLPGQATVVIEFGGEFEVPGSTNRAELNLYPYVDGNPPQFFAQDAAHYSLYSGNNTTYFTTQCSRLVTRSLGTGSHTVTIWASVSSDLGATIRNPWLKVTKM